MSVKIYTWINTIDLFMSAAKMPLLLVSILLFASPCLCQDIPQQLYLKLADCPESDENCAIEVWRDLAKYHKATSGEVSKEYLQAEELLLMTLLGKEQLDEAVKQYEKVEQLKQKYGRPEELKEFRQKMVIMFRLSKGEAQAQQIEQQLGVAETEATNHTGTSDLTDPAILEKRVQDCMLRQDYHCAQQGLGRILQLLEESGKTNDPQYLKKLSGYIQISLVLESYNTAIPALEKYFKQFPGQKTANPEEYQQFQGYLSMAYQLTGEQDKMAALDQKLNSDPMPRELNELLQYILKQDEYALLRFSQNRAAMARHLIPALEQYILLAEAAGKTNHPDYLGILQRLAIEYQSAAQTEEEAFRGSALEFAQKSIAVIDKMLKMVKGGRDGKLQTIDLLEQKAISYGQLNKTVEQLNTLGTAIEIAESVQLDEDRLSLLKTQMLWLATAHPQESAAKKYLTRELEQLRASGSTSAQSYYQELQIEAALNTEEQLDLNKVLAPIEYPSILDKFSLEPAAIDKEQVKQYYGAFHSRLYPEVFQYIGTASEYTVFDRLAQDEDALLSFIEDFHAIFPEAGGEGLNYYLALKHWLQQAQIRTFRKVAASRLPTNKPLYEQLQQQDIAYLEMLKNPALSIRELLQKAEESTVLHRKLYDTANKDNPIPPPPSWQSLQQQLNPKQALVTIHRFIKREKGRWKNEVHYGALILKAADKYPIWVSLPAGDSLDYEYFQDYISYTNIQTGSALYKAYWAPIARQLSDLEEVFVVPGGIYNRINISSIPLPGLGKYVMDELRIQPLGSPQALLVKTSDQPTIASALFIGNPDYAGEQKAPVAEGGFRSPNTPSLSNQSWDPLPGTAKEVQACRDILERSGIHTTSLTGAKASENALFQIDTFPSIVHFATHAFFRPYLANMPFNVDVPPTDQSDDQNDTYPSMAALIRDGKDRYSVADSIAFRKYAMENEEKFRVENLMDPRNYNFNFQPNSGLVLSGANRPTPEGDGIFTASEILGLNLSKTRLAVMSACNSGISDLLKNAALTGLRSAFETAGVPYVINTLWPVRDNLAEKFMVDFYTNWIVEKQTIEAAFHAAQLHLRQSAEKQQDWAGFVLVKF